jgi:pimeloyl-ACP methyl ester carboxylesterase
MSIDDCRVTGLRRPRCVVTLAAAAALLSLTFSARPAGAAPVAQSPALPGSPVCGPSTAQNEPTGGRSQPPPAPRYFAADFPAFNDDSWGAPLGGFGGLQLHSRLRHTPVIFVHGNQADAQNWLDVMEQFQNNAHYTMQEMYALSYNGLGNYYAGTPTRTPPSSLDQAYLQQNPTALANGGHGAADDDEVPDLCRFVEAVQWYTGSRKVDLVGHSLGVTIIRKFMFDYPSLAKDVVAVVGIAGANHGTTVCRGLETSYYGCNEIAPGTPWLAQLNGPGGSRETYAPTTWMTVYNGLEGDPFFVGPDAPSPQLRGADNRTFAGEYHNDLRVGAAEVDTYLAFLLRHGQAGSGAAGDGDAVATDIETTPHDGHSAQLVGIPLLTS